jgi:hypothetical protein
VELYRIAKYAPFTGLVGLFVVSLAFSLVPAVTREHVALTALVAAVGLGFGGVVILADPRRAVEYDDLLTPPRPSTDGAATTIMTASGLGLALGAMGLVAVAVRLL